MRGGVAAAGRNMTLDAYARDWLARQRRLAPNTIKAYGLALRHHILPRFGRHDLGAITTPDIRDWLRTGLLTAEPNTVKSHLAALSALLMDALLDGLIPANPAHGAGRRLWPREVRVPKALTGAQLAVLTYAADLDRALWLGAWVRIGARTGLRPGEQLALTPECLEEHLVRVEQTYHGVGRFGPPKGGRRRVVEVSHGTGELLAERARLGRPFLFPGRHRDRPLDPASLDRAFGRAIHRAGLPAHLTPHCLRHTYASLLLAAGAPPQYVRQQMGHASIKLTVDVYGSWIPASRPDLLAVLDEEPERHPPRPARHHGIGRILPFTRPQRRRA